MHRRERARRAEHPGDPRTATTCRWGTVGMSILSYWLINISCQHKCDHVPLLHPQRQPRHHSLQVIPLALTSRVISPIPTPLLTNHSSMAPKPKKVPSASAAGASAEASTPKLARLPWKTGIQLEYLLTQWQSFLDHQSRGALEHFWPRVFETWYEKWPITPTPTEVSNAGSASAAMLVLRSEKNQVRLEDLYPHAATHLYFLSENLYMVSQ